MEFKELNPLLHNQLRLSILSLLISVESAEFNFLLEKTGATKGNLSVQINKLKEANYLEVKKSFRNNYPLTTCKITSAGIDAFEQYVKAISEYLNVN
ncbi:MAG: transcriptional regulator [Bacteroidales bacterium]|nr:transcriptional regulator [Bacteroidales bacterium]